MNDLMSGGMHRLWKAFTIQRSGVREGSRVLDVAGGTGDLSLAFAKKVGKSGQVWLTDINNAMLAHGRDRLLDKGYMLPVAQCDAEKLPFPDEYFDCVTVAFGLRNMTHKDAALKEMCRVLKPGGRLVYATCSLLEAENEAIVSAFLAAHPEFVSLSAADVLGKQGIEIGAAMSVDDRLRLLPHRHGTDGFFAAVLQRT